MRMKFACALSALGLVATAALPAQASTQFFGPTPYLSAADSPFVPADYAHFYLEDFETGAIVQPGFTATGSGICVSNVPGCFYPNSGLIDSVGNGGDPNVGHSLFASGGMITITFDAAALGALPTAAGLVWTDGLDPISFQAYDENGLLLGGLTGNSADDNFAGGTAEDRFYGVINAGGVSKLVISDPSGIEIDHVQYGVGALAPGVPEPAAWALMLTGFFGAGGALRTRRRVLRLA
jgi:hypothetical protein